MTLNLMAVINADATVANVPRPNPPAVMMICQAGQFDINFGSASEVASALGLELDVAKRLVAQRPWYRPDDLLTIAGIGPGWLAANRGRMCATPMTTPPPAIDVCPAGKIDVQTASKPELQVNFGLSSNTADNLIKARPYSALRQITPERVPGLGTSSQKKLKTKGCLTPATITAATTTWRWAYSNTTTTNDRGLFKLAVPAGSITSSPGAWLSITDATAPSLVDGPTADFHIWGSWANQPDASVRVTGPSRELPEGADTGWVDVIIHYTDEGAIFMGPGATTINGDGTITVSVDSLSLFSWVKAPLEFLAVVGQAVFSALEWVESAIRWFLGLRSSTPACDPDITQDPLITTEGSALESIDPLGDWNSVPVKYCVGRPEPGLGEWKVANNLGTVIRLYSPSATIVGRGLSGDALTDALFATKGFTSADIELPPGGSASIQVDQGSPRAEVAVTVGGSGSIHQAFVARTLGRLPIGNLGDPGKVAAIYQLLNSCAYANVVKFGDIDPLIQCAAEGALILAESISVVFGLASIAFDIIVEDVETLELGLTPRNLFLKYFNAPSPSQPNDGTIDPGDASPPPTGEMRILKRADSIAAYLWDSNGVAHHIADGATYICLAQYWPVRYNLDSATFDEMVTSFGDDASCPPPVGEKRELLRSNTDGFLLRQANGTTYLIKDGGFRVPIFSGDFHFNCLAASHEVWDYVTPDELETFPQHPSEIATGCLDGPIQG